MSHPWQWGGPASVDPNSLTVVSYSASGDFSCLSWWGSSSRWSLLLFLKIFHNRRVTKRCQNSTRAHPRTASLLQVSMVQCFCWLHTRSLPSTGPIPGSKMLIWMMVELCHWSTCSLSLQLVGLSLLWRSQGVCSKLLGNRKGFIVELMGIYFIVF